jgi:Ca2+-binding RTX toxin-like protein
MPRLAAVSLALLLALVPASTALAATLVGGPGPDQLAGGAGADRIVGRGGDDRLFGGPATTASVGGAGNDLLAGRRGQRHPHGRPGRGHAARRGRERPHHAATRGDALDVVVAGNGNDRVNALDGSPDRISCGPGRDRVRADPRRRRQPRLRAGQPWLRAAGRSCCSSTTTPRSAARSASGSSSRASRSCAPRRPGGARGRQGGHPAAMLLDSTMPDLDGLDVLERLRAAGDDRAGLRRLRARRGRPTACAA